MPVLDILKCEKMWALELMKMIARGSKIFPLQGGPSQMPSVPRPVRLVLAPMLWMPHTQSAGMESHKTHSH